MLITYVGYIVCDSPCVSHCEVVVELLSNMIPPRPSGPGSRASELQLAPEQQTYIFFCGIMNKTMQIPIAGLNYILTNR